MALSAMLPAAPYQVLIIFSMAGYLADNSSVAGFRGQLMRMEPVHENQFKVRQPGCVTGTQNKPTRGGRAGSMDR